MRRDNTPTRAQPHDTLGAQLGAYRQDPTDFGLFDELRASLKKANQAEQLAEIYELRAPLEPDMTVASSLWSEAGALRKELGELDRAERDLRNALGLDSANQVATAGLVEIYLKRKRHAEAAAVLEAELTELESRIEGNGTGEQYVQRRADRHRLLAHLWDKELGRVDRALFHWQRAWKLEPADTEALEAAREVYRSLGDEKMVVQLYEAELEVLADGTDKARRGKIELELGQLLVSHGKEAAAIGHLEIALQVDPKSMEVREVLADAHASPAFAGKPDHNRRAAQLFVELAKSKLAGGDQSEGIRYLRRALGVDPYSDDAARTLEGALKTAERWDELDRLYQHRSEMTESRDEQSTLLAKRAELYDDHLSDRESLKKSLEQLASNTPPGGEHSQRLRRLYREDGDWRKLVALIESELESLEGDPNRLCDELLDLALITREQLRDRDRAAEYLHRILSINAHHTEAVARYQDHFRERRDWRGLADLIEFAIENAQDVGAAPSEIVDRLEELAKLSELRLGDVERAINTWRRIEQFEPSNPKVQEALRRLMSRAKMWESLVGVLEQEAEAAQTPQARAEAHKRIAQVYRERQVNPRRAIALYEDVLTVFADDEGVLKALSELYEREGDDAGLANTMRRQLDLEERRLVGQLGDRPGPKDWPVSKRVERLTSLRRLAGMYEQQLADVEGVVFACSGILEILPGDRDALDRMERVLEKAGDHERLEQTLEYHAAAATGPAEKAKVLRRLARLAEERKDEITAMARWESVLKASPNEAEALGALAGLYERHQRWSDLAAVLERTLLSLKPPEPGSPEAANRAADLSRYARVVDSQLKDDKRAVKAWNRVLEITPRDREALDALARLYEKAGQWRPLSEILERQVPLYLQDDPPKASEVALRRAQLLEERLGDSALAARALEHLITHIDPANLAGHQALRRLHESRGDFEAAVRVAERELYLTPDDNTRIARGLEIGLLCRDRLSDPTRALQAYERVFEIDANHPEALAAASELYARVGDYARHIETLERRIPLAPAGRDRRTLMLRAAQTYAEKLNVPMAAFEWYRKAHEHAPDATTIAEIRRAAEAHELWEQLADVYQGEREKLAPPQLTGSSPLPGVKVDSGAYVAACREVAAISEHRLGDNQRAIDALHDALIVVPRSEDLLSEVERIATEWDDKAGWSRLLDCLQLRLQIAGREERVALHCRRARIREERLADNEGATEELLRAFSWAPDRAETRQALIELSERTGSWEDLLSVESALFESARTTADRVDVLRRKAQLVEDRTDNKVRAFRTHLAALLLAPEDADTVAHLWRLARAIGSYEAKDKTPQSEPPAAYVEPSDPGLGPRGAAPGRPPRGPQRTATGATINPQGPSREDRTQELNLSDLMMADSDEDLGDVIDPPAREDRTMQLDLNDLEEVRRDPTMELRTQDLIEVLGARDGSPPTPPSSQPLQQTPRGAPPPPPPRPPEIRRGSARPPRSGGKTARPAPTLPVRPYDSPWAEFAAAYELLPAKDVDTRLRWQFRAAEVWETGAGDIAKAFEVLAGALQSADDDSEPRARLHRLATDHQQWDRLAELYEDAAENAGTPERATELIMEVAHIRGEQGRSRETEALYRQILGIRPDYAAARERLEALYRADSRWVDLAASLEERTDPRLGSVAPEAERPALLRELAELYSDKLDHPHDAIEALTRLRALTPDDLAVLEQMASLYARIGRWSKVIEVLQRVCFIGEGTDAARDALARIGHIYEVELELPDKAIESYRNLIMQWPEHTDALMALDRLYQHHARWEQLEEILDRRAAVERDAAVRVDLLRRRAHLLLEFLEQPEQAASALRHARTADPENVEIADELIRALVAAGREREAAASLEGRAEALRSAGASTGDIAAVLIRLASLRANKLGDPQGAHQCLEEALSLVPNHPTALATLASLAELQKDPRTFADAKMREAEVQTDVDAKVDALMAAGTTLRDECGDAEMAATAFEKVLALRPYHAEATWALAALVERAGDLDEAGRILEARLGDESLSARDRAQVLTQLAALSRLAGVDAAAERRLAEALNQEPTYLPAVLGTADLFVESDRFGDLEAFLSDIIPDLEDQPPEVRAELMRRQGIAFENLDRSDDAYQTLLEADRLSRGNLLVKLALGENRYRARRWREAALHLSTLAGHEEAEVHPTEVAEGLYHAALAEIRSLRPEKAEALYEAAIELKPNFKPALQALAELSMEKGKNRRAADLLTRQAASTDNPEERMRLFEALGDMALLTLGDEDRARVCFEAAIKAADPIESKHIPLLEKLLERQDLAADHLGAAETAELMASFAQTDAARAMRLKTAAENYYAAGQKERALEVAERAIGANPEDITAVTIASELTLANDDYERTASLLSRALQGDGDVDELSATRQALLWYRLAVARLERGDDKGAITALETSTKVAPESDGAMMARRKLVSLWSEDPAKSDDVLTFLRAVASDTLDKADVAALARALIASGDNDGGRAVLELAGALGHDYSDEDVAFFGRNPARNMAEDEAYRGSLEPSHRALLLTDEADAPLADVFAALWDAVPMLWPSVDDIIASAGLRGAERITATAEVPAAAVFTRVARALDCPPTVLFRCDRDDAPDVSVLCSSPPIVVLGPRVLGSTDDQPSELELRFLLARAADMARPERVFVAGLPEQELDELTRSLLRIFGKESATADDVAARDDKLRKQLPVRVRRKLEKVLAKVSASQVDTAQYRQSCDRVADRAGLLICGDIDTALRAAGSRPGGAGLTRYLEKMVLSPGYLEARKKLGVGVRQR